MLKSSQRVYDWIAKNRAKHNKRMALYMREYNKRNPSTYVQRHRIMLLDLLGMKCSKCGFSDVRALQIDHINGNGHKERLSIHGIKFYRYYLKNIDEIKDNIQLLCANCNFIKKLENNEHSHKGVPRKY